MYITTITLYITATLYITTIYSMYIYIYILLLYITTTTIYTTATAFITFIMHLLQWIHRNCSSSLLTYWVPPSPRRWKTSQTRISLFLGWSQIVRLSCWNAPGQFDRTMPKTSFASHPWNWERKLYTCNYINCLSSIPCRLPCTYCTQY